MIKRERAESIFFLVSEGKKISEGFIVYYSDNSFLNYIQAGKRMLAGLFLQISVIFITKEYLGDLSSFS